MVIITLKCRNNARVYYYRTRKLNVDEIENIITANSPREVISPTEVDESFAMYDFDSDDSDDEDENSDEGEKEEDDDDINSVDTAINKNLGSRKYYNN